MSEVGADDLNPTGHPRLPISDISVWVEKYSTLAAILIQRFPEKGPEVLPYQALIVRCERNYRGSQWVVYDRAFRCEALAAHDLNWSLPNPRLFQEAFTERAKYTPRCYVCLDDRVTYRCDNQAVVACLRSRTSRPGGIMHLLRCVEACYHMHIDAIYTDTHCKPFG